MNTPRRIASTALLVTALLASTACGQTSPGADDGKLEIATSFYPLQYVAQHIAGDHATVTNLTPPAQEPHDLELSPKQIGSLADVDLMLYLSGFQGAVDDAVKTNPPKLAVDAATLVTPLTSADEADHADESAEEHAEHDHGANDPHVWLAPKNMVAIAEGVTAKLVELDPASKADYEANKTALVAKLTTLDADFTAGLKNCQRTEFITSHDAFGYLAHAYGLTQIGISGLSPDEEPSPARIAEVQKLAKRHGVTTIFYETLVSPETSKSIAGDLGLKTDVLDPVEGITDESRGKDYVDVMNSNLAALKTANECA